MKFGRVFIVWLSIIGSIASLIGVVYVFYPIKENNIKLDFIVSSCDNLTVFNNVSEPEIKAQFEYKGNKIPKLWRINLVLKNVSDKTIIGSGQLKNIMYDKLVFFVKNKFQIIDKKLIKSDFNHTLTILSNDTVHLSFGQWRAGEKLEYSFYVTSQSSQAPGIEIFSQPRDRQIVDGDIRFLREFQTQEKDLVTNKLGKPVKRFSYILFIVLFTINLLIVIVIIISNPVGYIKRKSWKRKNLSLYNQHIIKEFESNQAVVSKYLNKPENYKTWNKLSISKYPNDWGMDFEINKIFPLMMTTVAFLVFCFALVVVIIDLIQQFP